MCQGDSNPHDDETNAVGYFEQSLNLEHGFLLTSDVTEPALLLSAAPTKTASLWATLPAVPPPSPVRPATNHSGWGPSTNCSKI